MTNLPPIKVPRDRESVISGLVRFRDRPREWWLRLRELRLEAIAWNKKRKAPSKRKKTKKLADLELGEIMKMLPPSMQAIIKAQLAKK